MTTLWGANDFTATSSDPITMVGFYTPVAGSSYEVYTAASHAEARTLKASGTLTYAGYHTVAIPSLAVSVDQTFSVILKLTTPGYTWPQAIEDAQTGYSSGATAQAGQSFVSLDGGDWIDIGLPAPDGWDANVCIKAFAKPVAADTTAPVTSVSGIPAGWSRTPVTASFTATDVGGSGVLFTQARVDSGAYRQCTSFQVTGDGTHTLYYCSSDKAGNMEGNNSATVTIDGTAPVTTVTVGAPTTWTNSAPTITLRVDDGGSGPALTQYRRQGVSDWTTYTTPFQVTTQGKSRWEYRSADAAGNTETTQTLDVKLDGQAPTTTAFAAKAKRRRAVALKYRVNDASPGCGSAKAVIRIYKGKRLKKMLRPVLCTTNLKMSYRWKCSLRAGRYTVRVSATDAAGNVQNRMGSARLTVK